MQKLFSYIRQFVNISQQEFEQLSTLLEHIECGKKHILTQTGDVENKLYLIRTGLARKYFYRNKEEIVTQIAAEGDLITSSVSFLSQKPSAYVIEAIEPCTFFAISYENLQKIYSMGPAMERLGRLITLDWLLQKEIWEHDRLRHEPRERFIRFMNENGSLVKRVQQKHLASYLNMKPETFSRYKHLLKA